MVSLLRGVFRITLTESNNTNCLVRPERTEAMVPIDFSNVMRTIFHGSHKRENKILSHQPYSCSLGCKILFSQRNFGLFVTSSVSSFALTSYWFLREIVWRLRFNWSSRINQRRWTSPVPTACVNSLILAVTTAGRTNASLGTDKCLI